MKTAIIDYGMGNLDSVRRAVEECNGNPDITTNPRDLKDATYIILPGDGAFPDGMENLKRSGFAKILKEQVIGKHIPFLGLCLGMQLLADIGFEGRQTKGLGWISGEIRRLNPKNSRECIPHIGWNEVNLSQKSPLFKDIPSGKDFYFIHSYQFICQKKENILATTPYCEGFASIIGKDNIFGVQFHPEKSQKVGLQLIKNFLDV